ncbi:MAG: lysophospholipid acyltransferase family protein [Pseudomonadota bacterium]
MFVMMLVLGIVFLPWAAVSRAGAMAACKTYCRWIFWTMGWMVGIKLEVRGHVPEGGCLIASKHQSFLDIMAIFEALPDAIFIMKRQILWTPVIGLYAWRLNCVPVVRGKRGVAIKKMLADVENGSREAGQLIIYSQGTRVPPGEKRPYKVGTGALYDQMKQPCYPVAVNVGHFWPRRGISRRPGTAVVEFLEPIQPGLTIADFMEVLETQVEEASDTLLEEAKSAAR